MRTGGRGANFSSSVESFTYCGAVVAAKLCISALKGSSRVPRGMIAVSFVKSDSAARPSSPSLMPRNGPTKSAEVDKELAHPVSNTPRARLRRELLQLKARFGQPRETKIVESLL